jgi:hypothetical protein
MSKEPENRRNERFVERKEAHKDGAAATGVYRHSKEFEPFDRIKRNLTIEY